MDLIDTHCHLAHNRLAASLPDVLDRAHAAGVRTIICAASDLAEAQAGHSLAQRHDGIYFTAGVHPHEAKDAPADYLRRLTELAADGRNVAIGEIGLDYHYDFSPRDAQRKVFAEQVALARRLAKPIAIHTREAFADTMAVLRETGFDMGRAVFHSFTEGPAEAGAVIESGAMISLSGIVTFKNAGSLRQAAALVPDDRLLIETDAPFLSPEPVRRMKTNEPANVAHVAHCLAAIRGVSPEALAALTAANARRFFGIAAR